MKTLNVLSLVVLTTIVSSQVFAAGYEKADLFSGKYGGLAGAATSSVSGSEALYFNPAGIGMEHSGQQVDLNFSPTFVDSEAPFLGSEKNSKGEFLPAFSAIYSLTPGGWMGLSDKWGFAIGAYTGGGLDAEYDNVSINPALPSDYKFKTSLMEIEYSLGVSYKVMPHLKVGAAYRIGMANAEFDAPNAQGTQVNLTDLSGWGMSYRLGAQWTEEHWGAGLNVRGPMDFSVAGNSSATAYNGTSLGGGGVTVKTQLPLEVSLGGHYDFTSTIRGYLEYMWAHYNHDQTLIIDGSNLQGQLSDVAQNFSDQHNVRIAGEYTGYSWPIRLGYVYSTHSENPATQVANFAPPGDGHTFSVGTGHTFMTHFDANGALEYAFSSKSDVAGAAPALTHGKYSADVYTAHLGLAYNF